MMDFDKELGMLVDAWCERRQLKLLSIILQSYPRVLGLTDEWAELANGLKSIRMRHANLLVEGELDKVVALQHFAEAIVYR